MTARRAGPKIAATPPGPEALGCSPRGGFAVRCWLLTMLGLLAHGAALAFTPQIRASGSCESDYALYSSAGWTTVPLYSAYAGCVLQLPADKPDNVTMGRASTDNHVDWHGYAPGQQPRLQQPDFYLPPGPHTNYSGYILRANHGNLGAVAQALTVVPDLAYSGSYGGRASASIHTIDQITLQAAPGVDAATPVKLRFQGTIEADLFFERVRGQTVLNAEPAPNEQLWFDFASAITVGDSWSGIFRPWDGAGLCFTAFKPNPRSCDLVDTPMPWANRSSILIEGERRLDYRFELDWSIGAALDIHHRLDSFVAAGFYTKFIGEQIVGGVSQSLLDGWGTSSLFIEVLGADGRPLQGVSILAASGHDYTPPVPEPGTLLLWLAGLGGCVLRSRRAAGPACG